MELIATRDHGEGVTEIRLQRPPVNALNTVLLRELAEAVAGLGDAKAVVVWGGDSVFAAGADITEFDPVDAETALRVTASFRKGLDALAAFPRPTVAAVTGYALGGGLELALCCDFRVAGDNARLGLPEIQLGVIPGGGGTQRLPRLVGAARAKDLVFSGRHVRSQEALDVGLVDKVVEPDDVFPAALEWARKLAAGAVVAMGEAKAAIDDGLDRSLPEGLDLEAVHFGRVFDTEDAATGVASFLEHGPGKAKFAGR